MPPNEAPTMSIIFFSAAFSFFPFYKLKDYETKFYKANETKGTF